MASGDTINFTNINTSGKALVATTGDIKNYNGNIIVFAPTICVQISAKGGVGKSRSLTVAVDALVNGSWTQVGSYSKSASSSRANSDWYCFGFAGGGASYNTFVGHYNTCVWRLRCTSSTSSPADNYHRIRLYSGGYTTLSDYNTYMRGKPIKYSAMDWFRIGSGYTYSTETACLNAKAPVSVRGNKVYWSNVTNVCRSDDGWEKQ